MTAANKPSPSREALMSSAQNVGERLSLFRLDAHTLACLKR
ncbi:hypothetical protein MCP1_210046 [Candidatus Terasakiella magnetica]|nr:hypothetical protein MCP1_210046 [Candidatus Terasakiella magnetica]